MRPSKIRLYFMVAMLLTGVLSAIADEASVQYHGSGWIQFGRVEHSTIIAGPEHYDLNKNWIQNTGGQNTAVEKISANWEGGLGLGAIQVSNPRGSLLGAHTWSNTWNPFVTEARVTYSQPLGAKDKIQLTVGSFPYVYNADVKNFGLYLTRGQVYPGTLFSGFETKHVQPTAATQVGGLARIQWGGFQNDVLLNSETETKPYFDLSLVDIASWQATPWLQVGGGVNFYRLIPQNPDVTSPGKNCNGPGEWSENNLSDGNEEEHCYILDTLPDNTVDTVTGSMSGTKLMARFRLDFRTLLGLSAPFGKQDFVLYGEGAILGLKDYPKYYDDIWRRAPIMVGFNLPAFGYLDKFCAEIEYYGSKNFPDYVKTETNASWVPRVPPGVHNGRNDWKWSLYASRVLMAHMRIAGQVANDHLVIPAPPSASDPDWSEALTTKSDWYWMLKLAYFF